MLGLFEGFPCDVSGETHAAIARHMSYLNCTNMPRILLFNLVDETEPSVHFHRVLNILDESERNSYAIGILRESTVRIDLDTPSIASNHERSRLQGRASGHVFGAGVADDL